MLAKKRILLIVIGLILVSSIAGCAVNQAENTLVITPMELFDREAEKFEPFMGMTSGSKLAVRGEGSINVDVEEWEYGQLVRQGASLSQPIPVTSGADKSANSTEHELIISVLPIQVKEERGYLIQVALSNESGTSKILSYVEENPHITGWTYGQVGEEQILGRGESVYMMGLKGSSKGPISSIADLEQEKETAEWMLLFRVEYAEEF